MPFNWVLPVRWADPLKRAATRLWRAAQRQYHRLVTERETYDRIAVPQGRKRRLDYARFASSSGRPTKRRLLAPRALTRDLPNSPLTPFGIAQAWQTKVLRHDPDSSEPPSPITYCHEKRSEYRFATHRVIKEYERPATRHYTKLMHRRDIKKRRRMNYAIMSGDADTIMRAVRHNSEDPETTAGQQSIIVRVNFQSEMRERCRDSAMLKLEAKKRQEDLREQAEIAKAEAKERSNQQILLEEKERQEQEARVQERRKRFKAKHRDARDKKNIQSFEEAKRDYEATTASLGSRLEHVLTFSNKPRPGHIEIESRRDQYGRIKVKPEKKRLLDPMTAEWEEKVATIIRVRNEAQVIGKSVEGVELSRRDIARLWPGEPWLNDEVVNAWYANLCARLNEKDGYKKGPDNVPRFVAYSSAWFKTATEKGVQSIANWSRRKAIKNEKLLRCERIFFPTNSGAHWTLLCISGTNKTIEYLDSMNKSGFMLARYIKLAKQWLQMELGSKYVDSEWEVKKSVSAQQCNTNDCGVFACLNGWALATGTEDVSGEFSADDMPAARRLFVATLVNGGFTGDFDI